MDFLRHGKGFFPAMGSQARNTAWSTCRIRADLRLEDFLHKLISTENAELLGLLTGADETSGDFEFVLDGHGDAAFAGAIKFGDDEAIERAGFVKFFGLLDGV